MLAALRENISPNRFNTYLKQSSGAHELAIQLYTWNIALGGALHGPIQALEVTLRNAIHNALASRHGEFWFHNPNLLKGNQRNNVHRVKNKLKTQNKQDTSGQLVAELSFGFWVALFAKRYDDLLWRTDLHHIFPSQVNRQELYEQLDRLRTLRNRITHHEPILQRDLQTDYEKLLWILEMLSPEVASWTSHHSRVLEVIDTDPVKIARF
ncbi:MAG: Abi family protein [bacterium]|nr:Abi family protein [bacterium]